MKAAEHSPDKPATAQDIHAVLGRIDAALVADILRTGASRADIVQALGWLDDDDYMGAELHRSLPGRARDVYHLLLADREPEF